jgi:hypothetical protein
MKSLTWKGFAAVAGGASGTAALVAAVFACSSSSAPPAPPAPGVGGQCSADPGKFPAPNCATYPSSQEMCATSPLNCNTAPCTSGSPCLAMGADNSGKSVADLRIRRLDVSAPPALAKSFVQKTVLNQGIDLHGFCGENGDGTFSWLIELDTANNKVTTGGAPPTTDPFGTGYCFVNKMIDGLPVGPVTVGMTKGSDGTWASDVIPKLFVPIYPPGLAPIILPITGATVQKVSLSSDNNCIGSYNPNAITSVTGNVCTDDITACDRWITAGSLGGYITLEEADQVFVPQLSESLCVLLTGGTSVDTSDPNEKKCGRTNGTINVKGDYCSSPVGPGACGDSYWLAAAFAASAAKISATPNQPDCMGGGSSGGDGGSGDGATGSMDAGGQ